MFICMNVYHTLIDKFSEIRLFFFCLYEEKRTLSALKLKYTCKKI